MTILTSAIEWSSKRRNLARAKEAVRAAERTFIEVPCNATADDRKVAADCYAYLRQLPSERELPDDDQIPDPATND